MTIGVSRGGGAAAESPPTTPVAAPASLPPLREELSLYPGAATLDGSPSWVLQDPVAHRFFRLGQLEFELLSRWWQRDPNAICDQTNRECVFRVDLDDIERLAQFLAAHNLLQSRGAVAMQRLQEQSDRLSYTGLQWLLKNYLFVRIPLLHPDKFLSRSLPYLRWLGSSVFLFLVVLLACIGVYLVQRQWDGFLSSLPHFFTPQGFVVMALALSLTKVLHEFGHAYCAKNYGCRVPTIGVAFLVMWPVLYTDASDAWRLQSRKQRLLIDAAGMATELVIAVFATLLWSFLPDGALRSAVFLLATATWVVTLFVNLNPFMRFDGYYLLSDLLGIPNLQDRAFAIAKWRLREFLFGWGEEVPEQFGRRTQNILLAYAYGTWIYRFFLFLGIALLVYFLFFKALGIFLMTVELVWFIARPVLNEISAWRERQPILRRTKQSYRTLFILVALFSLFVFPWQSNVSAPAVWGAKLHTQVYVPRAGRVVQLEVEAGDFLSQGQVLLRLQSPDLEYEITQGEKQLDILRWQNENQSFNRDLQLRSRVIWQELEAQTLRQSALLKERERLTIRSPIKGQLKELQAPLNIGDWLAENELLAVIADAEQGVVEAFVGESHLARVNVGSSGRFFPENIQRPAFNVALNQIDSASTAVLRESYLSSTQGGPIAVREDSEGRLIPDSPVYRVVALPIEQEGAPDQQLRGVLRLEGERISLFVRFWRSLYAILVRESGF